jgi:hypothetical integral membrane protein (TIGR02206 family)
VKDFLIYFFGVGSEPEFALFTPAHFAPIALLILAIWLLRKNADRLRRSRYEETFRYILGFALIICDMSYYWRFAAWPGLGAGAVENLPIGVCGWAVIFCSYMIIGKNQTLFDIVYFWLFSGTIFALITPTVISYTGPTRFRYYQFWLEHTLGYVALFYMIFVHKMRPTVRSIFKSYAALAILGVIAFSANRIIGPGANYLFLAKPEDTPSILDILPPNFLLRLVVMAVAVTAMFLLSYLPWYLKDRREAKQSKP